MSQRVAVRNAGDREQVRAAERQGKDRQRQWLADLRMILSTPGGRRVFQGILDYLQPPAPMWEPNAVMQRNAARHDVGTWLKEQIDEADGEALVTMAVERRNQTRQDELESRAASPKPAETELGEGDD